MLLQREVNRRMAQENTARVITIAATEQPQDIRLRVAAYARVSSSSDEQLNSFAAQNRYYTELISGKDNWQLVDIYADEGITGTSIEKRDDFKRMLRDCERGLIDRILVKSISLRKRALTPAKSPARCSPPCSHRWHRPRASPYLRMSSGA